MKAQVKCQLCVQSTKPGRLWIGGGDWLECPDCGGTAVVTFDESRYTPKERTVFIPQLRPHVERKLHIHQARLVG